MPHFGLMSTKDSFENAEGALLRARLHVRGAKRRLGQGKISAGIVTLYDALIFALRFHFMSQSGAADKLDLTDERAMFSSLLDKGSAVTSFDIEEFERLVEQASVSEMNGFEYKVVLAGFEDLMTFLGVMPFDEAGLPPEDVSTF